MKKTIIESARIIVIAGFLSLGLSIAYAANTWTGPLGEAPNLNAEVPINVGSSGQSKDGNLLIINSQGLINGLIVANGNVGIGTIAPTAKLEVAGTVKITGGAPGAGKVLTSDASGLASWQTPASAASTQGVVVYKNLSFCSNGDEITFRTTCNTASCSSFAYYRCDGTCGQTGYTQTTVSSPQNCPNTVIGHLMQ